MSARRAAVAVVVGLVTAAVVLAQPFESQLEVEAVVVPVTVRNAKGRLVDDVPARKFHLFVDGMEFPIQDLAPEVDLPLSLAFVLDSSGSMGGTKQRAAELLIRSFLAQRRPGDEVALYTFAAEEVQCRFPFGSDWHILPRILVTLKPRGETALYDVLLAMPQVMDGATNGRRAIILLTDGVDTASELTLEQATELSHRMRTPIYVVGIEPPPTVVREGGPTYEEVLGLLADASGGRYLKVPEVEEMGRSVHALLRELSARYIISFETSGIGRRKWRELDVKVDGYEATTRAGYTGTLP